MEKLKCDITAQRKDVTQFVAEQQRGTKDFIVQDVQCPSLILRGQYSKSLGRHKVSWCVRGRIKTPGKSKTSVTSRLIVDHPTQRRYGDIRMVAVRAVDLMNQGHDPADLLAEFRHAQPKAPAIDENELTFGDIRQIFLEAVEKDPDLSPSTYRDYRYTLHNQNYVDRYIPADTPVSQLTEAVLDRPIEAAKTDFKKSQARKFARTLNNLGNFLRRDRRSLGVDLPKLELPKDPKPRTRFPGIDDVRLAYQRLVKRRLKYRHHPSAIIAAQVLLLTAQRSSTVRHARKGSLKDAAGFRVWHVDEKYLKTGGDDAEAEDFYLPITEEIEGLMSAAETAFCSGFWLFPRIRSTNNKRGSKYPGTGFSQQVICHAELYAVIKDASRLTDEQIAEAEGDETYAFSPHDVRRAFKTDGVDKLKQNTFALRRVLAHKFGTDKVNDAYDRAKYLDIKAEAITAWVRYITQPIADPMDVEGATDNLFTFGNGRTLVDS